MHMQNKAKRIISLILLLAMIITMLSVTSVSAFAAEDGVAGFVQRCYQVTLNREPDETGYADWTGKLTSGEMDGATVAWGFVFSDEYTNANKDNGAFVTDMYTLFLDRTPDEAGYNDWVGKMEAGADRQEIFYGFANSVEFFNICTDYGVTAGYFTTEYNKDQVNAVNMFVARMYRICFGRLGDQGGQADWTSKLLRGELTGIDCAAGFINSNEYQNLNLSNEDYIRNMYRTFLGREADETGFNDWVSQLENGNTRDEIFAGFANSTEFQSICDGYGIVRGDYTAQPKQESDNGFEQTLTMLMNAKRYEEACALAKKYSEGLFCFSVDLDWGKDVFCENENNYPIAEITYKKPTYNRELDNSDVSLVHTYELDYGDGMIYAFDSDLWMVIVSDYALNFSSSSALIYETNNGCWCYCVSTDELDTIYYDVCKLIYGFEDVGTFCSKDGIYATWTASGSSPIYFTFYNDGTATWELTNNGAEPMVLDEDGKYILQGYSANPDYPTWIDNLSVDGDNLTITLHTAISSYDIATRTTVYSGEYNKATFQLYRY